jgi:hypothetical protein
MAIPRNEIADKEAKAALEDDLFATEKYPPQNLINWIKTEEAVKTIPTIALQTRLLIDPYNVVSLIGFDLLWARNLLKILNQD